jgi:hypothetical protein
MQIDILDFAYLYSAELIWEQDFEKFPQKHCKAVLFGAFSFS